MDNGLQNEKKAKAKLYKIVYTQHNVAHLPFQYLTVV